MGAVWWLAVWWSAAGAADLRLTCEDVVATAAASPLLRATPPAVLEGIAMGDGVTLGPLMRKTGSTTMTRFGNPDGARASQVRGPKAWGERAATRFVASVRDPVQRFVSGYRQVQVFYELGWIGKHWFGEKAACQLRWVEDDCEINYALRAGAPRRWRPADTDAAFALKVRRLLRFLSDVERCGFFDDHLYPMAHYFSAAAKAGVDVADRSVLVHTDALGTALPAAVYGNGVGGRRPVGKAMVTGGSSWSKLLVNAAHDAAHPAHGLALNATRRICRVVAADYACFPFAPPPACAGFVDAAAAPPPPAPYPTHATPPTPPAPPPPGAAVACVPGAGDPLDALLRAYAEIEGTWLLGWRDAEFEALRLNYTARHCFEWHQIADQVANPTTNLWRLPPSHRHARLAAFLADVAAVGFFDAGLRPAAARAARPDAGECHAAVEAHCVAKRIPVDGSPKDGRRAGGAKCARAFYNARLDKGEGAAGCTLHALHEYVYTRGERPREEPWVTSRAELVRSARDSPGARAVLLAACALYEADFACAYAPTPTATSPGCAAIVESLVATAS